MNNIDKIFDSNESIDDDINFKKAYNKALAIDFKKELKNDFEKNYKSKLAVKKTTKLINIKSILAIAASILLIVSAFFIFQPNETSYEKLMAMELSNKVEHMGNTKGGTDIYRVEAIDHYNKSNYSSAIAAYDKITDKTSEDNYFLALSYFYNKDYQSSLQIFSVLLDSPFSQGQDGSWRFHTFSLVTKSKHWKH
ncbi:MAG TPA: hypothetical protein PLY70_09200 [Saprospiraceae bacterium]|nr:hypothetical protein [Saprospiraceae bacterium]